MSCPPRVPYFTNKIAEMEETIDLPLELPLVLAVCLKAPVPSASWAQG